MKHASLFSGIGGFDLAAEWMGWTNVFHCEINQWCRKVLNHHFTNTVSYEDITKTDFTPWRGKIDILTGGFPCQPFSVAGGRKGQDDDRYLWPQMLRAIREIRPTWVIGENVAGIISMVQPGEEITVESQASLFETADKETIHDQEFVIESVCRDLEREGYTVQPLVIPACATGAPHRRDRVWFIAYRPNAGTKDLQPGGKNGIYGFESNPNTSSKRLQTKRSEQFPARIARVCTQSITHPDGERCNDRCDNWKERSFYYNKERNTQEDQPKWTEQKCRIGPNCSITANAQCFRRKKVLYNLQSKKPDGEFLNPNGFKWDASDTPGKQGERMQSKQSETCKQEQGQFGGSDRKEHSPSDWSNFPTQSPVCSRDDGFSSKLDGITFSKWREESVKAYGNAIVPHVAYEIFKSINIVNEQK